MTLAGKVDLQPAGVLVQQEGEQADHRVHRRPATDDAGEPWGHAGGGLGDFPGEQHQRRLVRVAHCQLDHHLAAVLALAVGAVGGLAAQQFDVHFAVGPPAALGEHLAGLVDDRLADPVRLGDRVDPGHQATGGAAEAVRVGGADLVLVAGGQAPGTLYMNLSGPCCRSST